LRDPALLPVVATVLHGGKHCVDASLVGRRTVKLNETGNSAHETVKESDATALLHACSPPAGMGRRRIWGSTSRRPSTSNSNCCRVQATPDICTNSGGGQPNNGRELKPGSG